MPASSYFPPGVTPLDLASAVDQYGAALYWALVRSDDALPSTRAERAFHAFSQLVNQATAVTLVGQVSGCVLARARTYVWHLRCDDAGRQHALQPRERLISPARSHGAR